MVLWPRKGGYGEGAHCHDGGDDLNQYGMLDLILDSGFMKHTQESYHVVTCTLYSNNSQYTKLLAV